MKTYSFEKLDVWKEARKLSVRIYVLTQDFPPEELYGLISQLRRSAISVSSNIAEGSGRFSEKDQNRFYEIAFGSLMEVLNQLIVSVDLGYILEKDLLDIRTEIDSVAYKLTRLISSSRTGTS